MSEDGLFLLIMLLFNVYIMKITKSYKYFTISLLMTILTKINCEFNFTKNNIPELGNYDISAFMDTYVPVLIVLIISLIFTIRTPILKANINPIVLYSLQFIISLQFIGIFIYFIGEDNNWILSSTFIRLFIPQYIYYSSILIFLLPFILIIISKYLSHNLLFGTISYNNSVYKEIQIKCISAILTLAFLSPIMLLTGKNYVFPYCLGIIFIYLFKLLICSSQIFDSMFLTVVYGGLIHNLYYGVGHLMAFDSCRFDRGFIGYDGLASSYAGQAILVSIEHNGAIILLIFFAPFIFINYRQQYTEIQFKEVNDCKCIYIYIYII